MVDIAIRNKKTKALLILDLDGFRKINDNFGYIIGDKLLKKMAQRLKNCIRQVDSLARLGSNKFGIILGNINDIKDIPLIAQRIINPFSKSFTIEKHEFFITASIGISVYPSDSVNITDLIKNANIAMGYAKKKGKNNYQFYSTELNARALEMLSIETDLRHGIKHKEFLLYYQPRIDTKTRKIKGMEALIRWQHPRLGFTAPDKFISIAEKTGLILPITEWILYSACKQTALWHSAGFPFLRVSVNITAKHFQHNLVETIQKVLKETSLSPNYLELEITENVFIKDMEATKAILSKLKDIGLHIAIDDFGTGYSSLSYLKQLPVNILKIDQSFVKGILTNDDDRMIVKTIIKLAHNFKLKVIAEGVETIGEMTFLQLNRCEEIQGYYFSHPLPVDKFTKLLKKNQ